MLMSFLSRCILARVLYSIPTLHACLQNIEYVKQRKRMMAMLSKLDLGAEDNQPFLTSWNSSVDQNVRTATRGSSNGDDEASLEHTSDDSIFLEEESIACFKGDTTLLRDMTLSTSQLLREIILPRLTKLLKSTQKEALVKCICETVMFLLTFTECVIAPRLRRAAMNARRTILTDVESLEKSSEVSDEEFVRLASTSCVSRIDDAALVATTEILLKEAAHFVTAMYSRFDPNGQDRSEMSAKSGEVVSSSDVA